MHIHKVYASYAYAIRVYIETTSRRKPPSYKPTSSLRTSVELLTPYAFTLRLLVEGSQATSPPQAFEHQLNLESLVEALGDDRPKSRSEHRAAHARVLRAHVANLEAIPESGATTFLRARLEEAYMFSVKVPLLYVQSFSYRWAELI